MEMDEALVGEPLCGKKRVDAALLVLSRHEHEPAFILPGLDADAPERVEVDLHPVASGVRRKSKEMAEAFLPKARLAGEIGCHGVSRAERARKPGPARMLGEMHDEIVAPPAQRGEEPPLVRKPRERPRFLPAALDDVDPGDRR